MDAAEMLANIPLFEDLSREDLDALAERMKKHAFEKGQTIFEMGDHGDSMYVVAEGTVSIFLPSAKGVKVDLRDCSLGQYFGELALFDAKPRSATAEALTACEVLELERDALHDYITKRPGIALSILEQMAANLRDTNVLLSQRASKDVNKEVDEKSTFGDRIADKVASGAGSWTFILSFIALLFTWMGVNTLAVYKVLSGGGEPFDPFPFIFFNLILSIVAAFQGPVIMMSQNRQSKKDRAQADTDFKVNLKNELGIENLQRAMSEMRAHVLLLEKSISSTARAVRENPTSVRPLAAGQLPQE